MEVEKQIETLLLSNLLKVSDSSYIRNHYRILRSGKPNCIYSLLESNNNYELTTTSYDVNEKNNNSNSYYNRSYNYKYALNLNL